MLRTGKHSPKSQIPAPTPSSVPPKGQVQGEGSYSGTRDYRDSVKSYLETADVEKDARDAAPDNADDARDMEKAEAAGRKGGSKTPTTPASGK